MFKSHRKSKKKTTQQNFKSEILQALKNLRTNKKKKILKSTTILILWLFKNCKQNEKNEDAEEFAHSQAEAAKRYKLKKKAEIDEDERIRRFTYSNLFGPIFICSCCRRRLYENGVTQITSDFKEKVNRKKACFYNACIVKEIKIEILFNGSHEKTGYYICITCRDNMLVGKMPAMAAVNGLMLTPIRQDCILTEFENNLIALNINF